ncbi:MAG: hypothetical protein UX04_C0002G0175 [Microgenomates group bacterium GW2011_GWF2_45_18]|nr:MAG: hypothetical protein UW18_C0009G0004 [Microgenomates group bacterium GW2011_GWF1_44_10]KKU02032.1 MAG: hypothetical protein UX04_C0002G0175 [Microgenomates group bacterium GW2011_GWF2_45_18]
MFKNATVKLRVFSVLVIFFMSVFLMTQFSLFPARAASLSISGRALSANTGAYLDFTNYNSTVRVNWSNGTFEGYAFSEDLGWVAFGTVDNAQGPVQVNTSTGAVTGKAKVISTGAYFDFTNYSSNVVINPSTGVLTGYVWSEDLGWFNFSDSGVIVDDFSSDLTEPATNASGITMVTASSGGYAINEFGWTKSTVPSFSWSTATDNEGGSGIRGYCVYLGTEASEDPGNSVTLTGTSGILTNSPSPITGTDCGFITTATSLDLGSADYLSSDFVHGETYYLRIKAIDNAGNTYNSSVASFAFQYDSEVPTNVSYISCASGSFSNVADMSFTWPITGSAVSADADSRVLGWQYQLNSLAGTWLGTGTDNGVAYIATSSSTRTLTADQDGASIVNGTNVVYFRTVDFAHNFSTDATIRTCNLQFGGEAPSFGNNETVTVTPDSSTTNAFALSWPEATPSATHTVTNYYYMTTQPPSTLATLQGNSSTYIDNGTSTSVSATALPNVNKGSNTVYVVAVDDADNYSPSNSIQGTFTLNSTDPDNVSNVVASDSSIKSESKWYATLTWTAPTYQGAGNLTYQVYRSTDNSTFTLVGTTTGLSYVDNAPSSTQYFYKIYTKDGANALSSGTNAVSLTPTGRYTSAPSLSSQPSASSITTKKAKITWSTSRSGDSKIAFGTSTGSYGTEEPSNSTQVTDHEITLTGLTAGTTYYYKARWTDEDGNTGVSEEKSFTTAAAPTVYNVSTKNITLTSAIIEYTVKDTSKVKIYFGTTTSFGGLKEVSTSTSESTYTTQLTDLTDGTKYFYKINKYDTENAEYEGDVYSFETLPRPKISNVVLESVANTAETTIRVSWKTNTEVSSIITVYPENDPSNTRDEVKVTLEKGERSMIVRGLLPQTKYFLVVRGRDKLGNEAVSDSHRFTTSTDTRPPQILNLKVIGGTIPPVGFAAGEVKAQLIITWDTDEPATSQVEFGQGSGAAYSQKSQYDGNITTNHTVILSGLTPSQVYHFRAISTDTAGNITNSVDTATIAPKATRSALDLVFKNLSEAFGFMKSVKLE